MSWFWTIMFLSFAIINNSESKLYHHQKSSAVVVGTVYCDTCFQQNLPKPSQHLIADDSGSNIHRASGASVTIQCNNARSGTRYRQQVKTDSHGEFKVHLPFPVSKQTRKIRGCSVRLINSNKPFCAVAASATSSNLHLKSRKDGIRVFSAGFFTFRPLKQPQVCDEKPSINNFKKLSQISNPNDPAFVPPIQDPPSLGSFLPPLPRLPPLPQLPRLPPLPGIPFLPPVVPKKQVANNVPKLSENQPDTPFPPNPFNLPNIFPPNLFQSPPKTIPPTIPPPSSSLIPPLFHSPNSPLLFNLPPIPHLIPSPPPTPPPVQLPLFPFQPTPGFPGVPPAKVSALSEKSFP